MEAFTDLKSTFVSLNINDIDTDQIIPARFLKVVDKNGLGENVFCDWRYDGEGKPKPDFVLNQSHAQKAKILVSGDNFGCGSSREHAPWALMAYGFRAIISTSFADIFRNNSLKNGLLPVIVPGDVLKKLHHLYQKDKAAQLSIDLASQILTLPGDEAVSFPIDNFSKTCLLEGIDHLGYLQKFRDKVEAFEKAQKPRVNTLEIA